MWKLIRQAFFKLEAEQAHDLTMKMLQTWSLVCPKHLPKNHIARNPKLSVDAFGVHFPNPIGLAGGFDKNALVLPAWQALGFGFVEVGTVTHLPQEGNPKPRLFRLPKEEALVNRLGFNNLGAKLVAHRIEAVRAKKSIEIPIGVNIGKSRVVSIEDAPKDYVASFRLVADVADYIAVNVSSPNTPGLRELQNESQLRNLLEVLSTENQCRRLPRPMLLKIGSDLAHEAAFKAAQIAIEFGFVGMIMGNTRATPEGGLSGRPIFEQSTELLSQVHKEVGNKLTLVGVGGIMDGAMAQAKLDAGAKLLQTYTGFVYGGPRFVKKLLATLLTTSKMR